MHVKSVKTHAYKIINRELSSSTVWMTCAVGMAMLVLPRIFPLAVNFLWYDDFTETPANYLRLHRFGSAADLAFWSWVFGPDYLRSYIPKLISIGYITVGVWALVQIFRAWKVPFVTALLAVLLFLVSPILTEYLVWNDISPENLAWSLVLIGYLAQLDTTRYGLAAGIALAFLGLGFNQIVVGLPAMLVLTEATILFAREDENSMLWKKRLVWAALPAVLYAGYLLLSHYIVGFSLSYPGGGSRGLATLSDLLSRSFVLRTYHEISLHYLNVFGPLLSYFFGIEAAWRGAWRVWVLIVLLVPTTLLLARASLRTLTCCVALFLAALRMPSAFGWVLNGIPAGWRLGIGMLLAFCLWFVALSVILLNSKLWRIVAFANLAALVLIIAQVPVTVRDAKNRALGFEATKSLVRFLKTDSGLPLAEATAIRIDIEPDSQAKLSGTIVMSFHEVGCADYSIAGYPQYLGAVLRLSGVSFVSEKILSGDITRRLTTLCTQSHTQQRCGTFGVRDPISNVGAACFFEQGAKNDTPVGADD
jgi:hypothetical protein